jgi:Ca2+-binding EF-hand superfamily protein
MKRTSFLSLLITVLSASWLAAEDAPKPKVDPAKVDLAKAMAEAQKRIVEKFDLDRDGKLSDAERLRAQEELKRMGALVGSGIAPGGFPGAEEFLKKFDKNKDGKLSDEEKLAAQAAMQQMRRGGGGPATGVGLGGGLPAGGIGGAGAPAAEGNEKPGRKVNPLIKLYDLDGDGKLNDEEKAALQADRGKKKAKAKEGAKKVAVKEAKPKE